MLKNVNSIINASQITGVLPVLNGGTGVTTSTGTGNTVLSDSPTLTGNTVIQGLTVGLGAGAVATNTAVGASAFAANVSGANNTAVGNNALAASTGSNNNALGRNALATNSSGSQNVAVGGGALFTNLTSSNSTAIGHNAGNVSTGAGNQFFGYNSGNAVTTGAKNVILGSYTGSAAPISATGSNYIILSDGDGNVRQTIDSSGNVGIGVTSPLYKLHVSGSAYITSKLLLDTGTVALPPLTFSGWTNSGIYNPDGNSVAFTVNGTERGKFSTTGLSVTGTLSSSGIFSPQQATTAGAPAYVKGAMYFDTTLNKLRIGGATGWETVTSV